MFQYLRSILYTFTIYLVMPIMGIIFAPWAIFSPVGARVACRTYARFAIWLARWMVGIRCDIRGTPPTQEVMIAAKHQSFLDIMMIYSVLPVPKFIMKKELMMTPVIGIYAKRLGCVPIDRSKRGAAIEKMVADVNAGRSMPGQLVIYPQGTRVAPGVDKPYKQGTGILYDTLDQPCVPVATNVGLFWPRKGILRKPGVAVVEFLPAIDPGLSREDFNARLEQVIETRSNELMKEAGFDSDGAH